MAIRNPNLQWAVALGLIPADIAEAFDDWADELAHRVSRGELTEGEANVLTVHRAVEDAHKAGARDYPTGKAAEMIRARATGKASN